jgi:hypothetical protein
MLLETLDIKQNDIIIYSKNIFNVDNNFRIIYKDDPEKIPHKINFGDVCRHINEFTPKNLIVYRLLTNIKDFELHSTKYGFFMYINGVSELIYFDPVFAVKELEEYSEKILNEDLRFRIQQVGLTTLNRINDLPNYAEIYSIDLEAKEAKFQNDKTFVDAFITSLQKQTLAKKTSAPEAGKAPAKIKKEKDDRLEEIKFISEKVKEDKNFDYKQISKINSRAAVVTSNKSSRGEDKVIFPKAVHQGQPGEKKEMLDMFKSPDSLHKLTKGKEDKKVVLKLNKLI